MNFRELQTEVKEHVGIVDFTIDLDFIALSARIDAALRDPSASGRFNASVTMGGFSFR